VKRFADSLVRQKGIKPPSGYKTSISICSAFLKEHAPKKSEGETTGSAKPVTPAQMLYAKKIAQGKGVVIPEEAKANAAAMSAWIASNRVTKRRKRGGPVAPQSIAKRRDLGKAKLPLPPLHIPLLRLQRSQIRSQVRRYEFLMATRRSLRSSALAIARAAGMPHLELIFLHSGSADGCNARRVRTASDAEALSAEGCRLLLLCRRAADLDIARTQIEDATMSWLARRGCWLVTKTTVEKGHGRIETSSYVAHRSSIGLRPRAPIRASPVSPPTRRSSRSTADKKS
jgi:hypothetical protein